MELKHLRNFIAVAELGSVSGAAEKLIMTQPPLSHQIKELEEELGVQLLIRHPRGVRLTAAGTAFLNDAKDVLARAESARHRARHQKDAAGGFVRIGYAPSTGHMILPRLIRRLRALRPAAKLEVREMFSWMQGQALQSNEIDVGLVRPPVNASLVVLSAQLSDPFCLAIPDGHALAVKGPIDLRDVVQEVFVSSTRPRGPAFFDQSLGLCADAGFSPDIRYEATTVHGILDLVGAGLGIAIVPGSMAPLAPAGVTLRLLRNPSRAGAIAFAQLRGDPNPLVATLAKLASEVFAEFGEEVSRSVAQLG
jgi:DNA-binding transcriptional LysR family regulator